MGSLNGLSVEVSFPIEPARMVLGTGSYSGTGRRQTFTAQMIHVTARRRGDNEVDVSIWYSGMKAGRTARAFKSDDAKLNETSEMAFRMAVHALQGAEGQT